MLFCAHANFKSNITRKCLIATLLLHFKKATSLKSFCIVCTKVYPKFKDAATLLGLLKDNSEWQAALQEADAFHILYQLRSLFSYDLSFLLPGKLTSSFG
jgi:hypothetical protein